MTDINEIFAKGGAMEALLEARDQKIVRYLGITGHYRPDALIEAIHRHPFDTILMAVNAADPHHYSFSEQLLPLAVSTVIIGCDTIAQLEQNVQLAREFTPLIQHNNAATTEKAQPVSKQS